MFGFQGRYLQNLKSSSSVECELYLFELVLDLLELLDGEDEI